MALELNGREKRALREALLDAFPSWSSLAMMLDERLDWKLATITAQAAALDVNAFELVQWAEARGQIADLIVAARNERPGNQKLEQFAAAVGLSSAVAVPRWSLEKIVGSNTTFLDVAKWRTALVRAEWRVCRVDRAGAGVGTGFLVGPDLLLTNHHVVEQLLDMPSDAARWSCRFDHKLSESGSVVLQGRVVALAADWCVDFSPYSPVDSEPDPKSGEPSDEQLDFALVRLAEPVGAQPAGRAAAGEPRGWMEFSGVAIDYRRERAVAILQHPMGQPMKLALGTGQHITLNRAANRIRYTVPTEPGSSGSPVFDGDWNLIALHHSGDPRTVNPAYNEGIPIGKIALRPKVAAALPR